MYDNMKKVAVMLARLPTLDDYLSIGLCSTKADGDEIVNALLPQMNDNLILEWAQGEELYRPDFRNTERSKKGCVFFECDVEGLEGSWYLPADLFEIRDNFDLKD